VHGKVVYAQIYHAPTPPYDPTSVPPLTLPSLNTLLHTGAHTVPAAGCSSALGHSYISVLDTDSWDG